MSRWVGPQRVFALFLCLLLHSSLARAQPRELPVVPPEIASTHFIVTVNGSSSPVMHAAMNLYFLNFDIGKRVTVSVTADTDGFWSRGVEVQPWRLGIRPRREGRTITFDLDRPAKISISSPGDFLGDAEMLYLFANAPEQHPPSGPQTGLRYFGPGVHRENIDAATGDTIYLAPGAVVFGSLNIWGVQRVKVFGRGIIVYNGPQNPSDDDGWMHRRNWHCIVMDNAHDISVEGITCVVRSRTWQIQMKDSRGIRFSNLKVIGANEGNANADGMDWLGGGDTLVTDSFFRAADDIFAMQGSWEGYGPAAFAVDGNPVTGVTVEDSVLSTSISNIVRAGWPEKNFEGGHFLLRNSDVLHMGLGGCGIPFALMEIWADPNGRGRSSGFRFENVRLEAWYSLLQLMQPTAGISDVRFTDVAALDLPSLVLSTLKGDVQGVALDNVTLGGKLVKADADLPLQVIDHAAEPQFSAGAPQVAIAFPPGLVQPGKKIRFEAVTLPGSPSTSLRYEWTFGDGTRSTKRKLKHRFPDTAGTLWDGSGRFRVLLHVTDPAGRHSWAYAPVVVADSLEPAVAPASAAAPGLHFRLQQKVAPPLPTPTDPAAPLSGISPQLDLSAVPPDAQNYQLTFRGYLDAPADGGYTFTLLSNDAGQIAIDGHPLGHSPSPFAQVCGLAGNAVRPVTVSIALAKGRHRLDITETHSTGKDGFRVWWQGPGIPLEEIPPAALSHDPVEDPE